MKMTKFISCMMSALLITTISMPLSVSAKIVDVDGVSKFENKDGSYATSQFVSFDKKKYYFDDDGKMVTGWLELSGKKYYFNEKGVMLTGLKKIDNTYYYFSSKGVMLTGTIKVKDNVYTFGEDGKLKSKYNGWVKFSGESYYCEKGKITKGLKKIKDKNGTTNTYFFDNDGKLVKSTKVNYKTDILYLDSSGVVYKTVDNSANIYNRLNTLYDNQYTYKNAIEELKDKLDYSESELKKVNDLLSAAKKDLLKAQQSQGSGRKVYGTDGSVSYSSSSKNTSWEQYYVDEYQKLQKEWKNAIQQIKDKITKYKKELKKIEAEIKELESYVK